MVSAEPSTRERDACGRCSRCKPSVGRHVPSSTAATVVVPPPSASVEEGFIISTLALPLSEWLLDKVLLVVVVVVVSRGKPQRA